MNTTQIHTFDITSPDGATDLVEGLVPMKVVYDNEYLAQVGKSNALVDEDLALRKTLDGIRDKYHILMASQVCNNETEYVGYTAGVTSIGGWYDSRATFVKPEFRKIGIGEKLKRQQIEYAKSQGCKGFITTIDRVNIQAYEMMKKLDCNPKPILGERDECIGWKIFLEF